MNTLPLVLILILSVFSSVVSGFYGSNGPVEVLRTKTFNKVLDSEDLWIVEFYAPWCGHCKTLAPVYNKAADALKGYAKFAAVDATVSKDIAQKYKITGYPTIKIFGKDKKTPIDYEGSRDVNGFIRAARKELKKLNGKVIPKMKTEEKAKSKKSDGFYKESAVVELTDKTFESEVLNSGEPWLVEFYAPWCGHCKSLAPEWKKAAEELVDTVKIGAVDATEHKQYSAMYNVTGFPSIKFFAPGSSEPEDYYGGRTSKDIVKYSLEKAAKYPTLKNVVVEQLGDQTSFENCTSGKRACGVFIVPHVIDTGADGRNKMLMMFGNVSRKTKFRGINYGWIVGSEHQGFEEALNIHANYPAFVVIGAKKMVFATLKRSFTEENIVSMVSDMFMAKLPMRELKVLPKLSNDVPLWDGKDYVVVEDEY
eukprot:Tbor_TRINITY_DN1932_c0_g1::TRINITY_DN1932_c0_g1_i1::g.3561::m.3561/K09584/PDIA6, TXNDC7; protein disulfide-isomerase A6